MFEIKKRLNDYGEEKTIATDGQYIIYRFADVVFEMTSLENYSARISDARKITKFGKDFTTLEKCVEYANKYFK